MLERLVLHDNGIPIYVQLREQLAALIGRGLLKPGGRLPTMREMAVALRIDLNTVQRAYAELERDGFLLWCAGAAHSSPKRRPRRATPESRHKISPPASPPRPRAQGIDLDELAAALAKLAERAS